MFLVLQTYSHRVSFSIPEFRRRNRFSFEHFAYWNRWSPRSKSLMNPFWLLSSSTHDWALFSAGFVKIGGSFYDTHANSNSQTCTHTHYTRSNTHNQKHILLQTCGVPFSSQLGGRFSSFREVFWCSKMKKLIIVLESLVMDVIISRGLFLYSRYIQLLTFGPFVTITRGRSDDFPY